MGARVDNNDNTSMGNGVKRKFVAERHGKDHNTFNGNHPSFFSPMPNMRPRLQQHGLTMPQGMCPLPSPFLGSHSPRPSYGMRGPSTQGPPPFDLRILPPAMRFPLPPLMSPPHMMGPPRRPELARHPMNNMRQQRSDRIINYNEKQCNQLNNEDENGHLGEEEEYRYPQKGNGYFENSQQEMNNTLDKQHSNIASTTCETCDKHFESYWKYQKHMSEHEVCGIDDCSFTAHKKVVEKHQHIQHYTGMYDKIKNLDTPDDIAKWISERKRKFAYLRNAGKKEQAKEAMIKRGEKLQRGDNEFDKRNKSRYALKDKTAKRRRPPKRKFQPKLLPNAPLSLIDNKSDWNGNLFPFRGTSQLYPEEETEEDIDIDDSEWTGTSTSNNPEKIILTNALGSLMSAYNSSDDSEIEDILPKRQPNPKIEETVSDNEPPIEEKIQRGPLEQLSDEKPFKVEEGKTRRPRKRFDRSKQKRQNQSDHNGSVYKKRKVTLLERLLANDIIHERNVLLQCIRHVVSNNYFKQPIRKEITNSKPLLQCIKYVVSNNFFKKECDNNC